MLLTGWIKWKRDKSFLFLVLCLSNVCECNEVQYNDHLGAAVYHENNHVDLSVSEL